MSLYFDAEAILTAPASGGSFKSRIYSARDLRAKPAQIYALVSEAAKWDTILAEVIENADILSLERKVSLASEFASAFAISWSCIFHLPSPSPLTTNYPAQPSSRPPPRP
jgi:hypothetical protein